MRNAWQCGFALRNQVVKKSVDSDLKLHDTKSRSSADIVWGENENGELCLESEVE